MHRALGTLFKLVRQINIISIIPTKCLEQCEANLDRMFPGMEEDILV